MDSSIKPFPGNGNGTPGYAASNGAPLHFHPALRFGARVLSYIFHPLFLPVYILAFLIYGHSLFPGFESRDKALLLVRFFIMYSLFPLVTVLLTKAVGFIDSVFLRTQRDRIIPYVACGVYYFWMWYVLKNQPELPRQLVLLALGIFLASSAGLILNAFLKISMHALSLGVMVAFILILAFRTDASFGAYISVALLIAGLVSTARLISGDHTTGEVYLGLLVGAACQGIAAFFF
ncbi:MAG TPA: hypothetical protein VHK69_10240 [Chitinophagaceae bacterium]|nr:hypothetical protein [Chitinophagaceae bacterium]